MPTEIAIIPEEAQKLVPLFARPEDYFQFRKEFMDAVIPIQEGWLEARRKSEEEARQRLLR